ncbi:ABC transporter permease [Fuerstiella marisgermanici]|uniref:ABC-type uncharacterized transport system, permease component n=1 Tax=Fuerstiella marisgermanici TaxID=1891926 RepID=A0A1P8WDF2_9PLAN|nr:ABC transporter permease [Fuerstiella marisgermanici]APZ92108.1 ABC-type uncharacterized transport system, permease component [Fuerstiella marisgermanici]
MTFAAEVIPLERLALALIPVVVVLLILNHWAVGTKTSLMAIARMLLQLLLLGFVLESIFEADSSLIVIAVLAVMLTAASWISLRVVVKQRTELLGKAMLAILVGGGVTLVVITQGVLQPTPWYEPNLVIPLAGMIFSNCMNAVSLAVERFQSEIGRGTDRIVSRQTALEAALIPITNSLFAVGLVSIPGMMTGQVLAGVSPVIAARYQIMVMCMMFGSTGMSVAIFLHLIRDLKPAGDGDDALKNPETPEINPSSWTPWTPPSEK